MCSPQKALEAFADPDQNPDLLRLESLLKRFNLFEAIGVIRQELRHSDLLACLLDSSHSHGLGTIFLTELLQSVFLTPPGDFAISQIDLDLFSSSQVRVLREWRHTDILVLDEANQCAIIIENKIDTGEHSGQLQRYYEHVLDEYPDYTIIALYLTRDGDAPSFDRYIPVSYSLVCRVIEKMVEERRAGLDGDIVMLLEHYALMLRRHIMSDSGVAELCRRIYQQHKQALDLIIEHRPDIQTLINEYTQQLIKNEAGIIKPCFNQKSYIQFNPVAWDGSSIYQGIYPFCPWFLYFQFSNEPGSLTIVLLMTPGDPMHRALLFDAAHTNGFQGCPGQLRGRWSKLFEKSVLQVKDYEKTQEEIEVIISQKWAEFLCDDLPNITEVIRKEKWLWEALPPGIVPENGRDPRPRIGPFVKGLVESNPDLQLYNYDSSRWQWLNFTLQDWAAALKYRQTDTNYAIFPYLTFNNSVDTLTVGMWIGPGSQTERQRVLQMAIDHRFTGVVRRIGQGDWIKITSFALLNQSDYEKTPQEIEALISKRWSEFLADELPRMINAVREEQWLWEAP